MGSERRRGNGNIPDLGAPPPVRSKPPESEATSSDSLFGSATFDGDFEGASLDLALDDAPDLRSSFRAPPSGGHVGDVIERTAESAQSLPPRSIPARPAKDERAWPTGTSPDSTALAVDPSEVALTAGFGPAPANAFAAIAYATRVVARRRELRARVQELNDRLTDAERDRDKLLSTMLTGVRAELAGSPDGRRVLEPVTRIEAMAVQRLTALSGENADYERRATELSREEVSLQSERDANAKVVERAAAELAARQHEHQREEAKKKRLYIEVTAVLDTVEKAGGRPTADQAAQLATREADIAAHKPQLDRAAEAVATASAGVESAQGTGKALEKRARDLERRRAALAAESRKRIGAHTQSVDEAEAHLLLAAADASRGVLAARGRLVDVPGAMLDAIQAADKMVADRLRELERHVRALDAHDAEGLKTGILTASGILVAVVLVAMVLLFR
jgi:hypothetical protein